MSRARLAGLALAVMLGAACAADSVADGPGDVTLVVGDVYTVSDAGWAEAFAYNSAGTIIAVGAFDELSTRYPDATEIDLRGLMVMPGFHDAHVHVPEAGLNQQLCFFPPGESLDRYEQAAVDCAADTVGEPWVLGAGASLFDLRDTPESPRDVLDRAVPDRPALILDDLGHAAWANSLALESAGITEDDPDPRGGVLHRGRDGRLSGLLLEDAQQLVRNAAAPDAATLADGLRSALEEIGTHGITTVSDAGGYWAQGHTDAWIAAADEGWLTLRARNTLYVYPDLGIDEQLDVLADYFTDERLALLQIDSAKVYVDGIFDLGTALMGEPYLAPPDPDFPSGFHYFGQDRLETYLEELHRMGFRVNVHVVGDGATTAALDAIEAIDAPADEVADRFHRLTHVYLVDPDDLPRFADLGVVADLQQGPDAIDPRYHDDLVEIIGPQARDLIPTADLLAADAHVILSSDWDADPLPPLGTIQRALLRDRQAVPDVETAVEMVTIDVAHALGDGDLTGSIEVGKQADFIALDQNLFEVGVDRFDETTVVLTAVDGRIVFEA